MEPQTKIIGDRTYHVTPTPTLKALDNFELLTTLIGPALGALAAMVNKNPDSEVNVAPLVESMFAKLGGGKLRQLTGALLDGVLVEENGKTIPMLTGFDLRFAGKIFEVFKVMAFVVEVNYKDFFDGARGVLGALPFQGDKPSTYPST